MRTFCDRALGRSSAGFAAPWAPTASRCRKISGDRRASAATLGTPPATSQTICRGSTACPRMACLAPGWG
eukprot:7177395-Alexandrium_andersonii.AAC.1